MKNLISIQKQLVIVPILGLGRIQHNISFDSVDGLFEINATTYVFLFFGYTVSKTYITE